MPDWKIKLWCLSHVCRTCSYNKDGKCDISSAKDRKGKSNER